MGAKDDAFGPIGGEASVMVGVEVREEVGDGVIVGEFEAIDDEAGFGDEFGLGEIGGDWGKRRVVGEERERERWRG